MVAADEVREVVVEEDILAGDLREAGGLRGAPRAGIAVHGHLRHSGLQDGARGVCDGGGLRRGLRQAIQEGEDHLGGRDGVGGRGQLGERPDEVPAVALGEARQQRDPAASGVRQEAPLPAAGALPDGKLREGCEDACELLGREPREELPADREQGLERLPEVRGVLDVQPHRLLALEGPEQVGHPLGVRLPDRLRGREAQGGGDEEAVEADLQPGERPGGDGQLLLLRANGNPYIL